MSKATFETALKQLDEIVQALESEDYPIEKALKKFEEGIAISKFCSLKLDETERKIAVLLKGQDGTVQSKPFDPDQTMISDNKDHDAD